MSEEKKITDSSWAGMLKENDLSKVFVIPQAETTEDKRDEFLSGKITKIITFENIDYEDQNGLSMEYYFKRNGTYYFRSGMKKVRIKSEDKVLRKMKYGQTMLMTFGLK